MTLDKKVLGYLAEQKGFRSGQEMARVLGVSRQAVWKAIGKLRDEGYAIEAVSNKGYQLTQYYDPLEEIAITSQLKGETPVRVIVADEIGSTNDGVQDAVEKGDRCVLMVANRQTEGKGRRGRSFYSPAEGGLYMSLWIRRAFDPEEGLLITSAAAVAVCQVLEEYYGLDPQIKWVNDIIVKDKKAGGILTESTWDIESRKLTTVTIGIGLNLFWEKTPPKELADIATPLFESPEGFSRNPLAAQITDKLLFHLHRLQDPALLENYRRRSWILGKPIVVSRGAERFNALAVDLDSMAGLVIKKEDGVTEVLNTGEVSVRLEG